MAGRDDNRPNGQAESSSISFGKVELTAGSTEPAGRVDPESPFRILVLGNFSGTRSETGTQQSGIRPVFIDRDNFDDVFKQFDVELELPLGGQSDRRVMLSFSELDDFHPDQLFEHLEGFQTLREIRRCLNNPETFQAAAEEVLAWNRPSMTSTGETSPDEASRPSPDRPQETAASSDNFNGEDLLNQAMEATQSMSLENRIAQGQENWNEFIREIVEPYVVPALDPQLPELLSKVDDAISRLMRAILHHPDFQALEAIWRGLHFLTRRLETGNCLKIFVADLSRNELAGDLCSSEDIRQTRLYKQLVEQTVETAGADKWSVLVGNFTFEPTDEDFTLLEKLAQVAQQAEAPFLAAAGDRFLGCRTLAETSDCDDWKPLDPETTKSWQSLRSLSGASYLGLILPRFLLRYPYNQESDPIEKFEFEELPEDSSHEDYLWGNPSFLCALLLGRTFSQFGWDFQQDQNMEVDGLPLHVFRESGESQIKPCAEVLLSKRAAERIQESGLMAFCSIRDQDGVILYGSRSISSQDSRLAGPWL